MNTADVIVLPYRDVLTSANVMLAMSFSKPVIAPALGCIPSDIDNAGSFIYHPKKKNGLVGALRKVEDANLKKMGHHTFKLAQKLDWDNIGKETIKSLTPPPAS